ncbi:MAG: GNAT family N-acetyltransferase [Clostridium sp.]|jgi:UDP-4-amino-4,6-dideoxy-N-acetyl-beta-L-altrosamine N-acetyltransferase|nr:GNAT family N-acetyltransferase [Clostridium sp.]
MNLYADEGAGIYLRKLRWEDTGRIVAWRNQDTVRRNFIFQELFTQESHAAWIRTMIDTGKAVQMIICETSSDVGLGSVYLRDIDLWHRKAEYGIFIGEARARGRGIGTAAAKLMQEYGWREQELHKIYLRVLAENVRAIRSYEKAGFRREGYLKEEVRIDGNYRDLVWMAAWNPHEKGQTGQNP